MMHIIGNMETYEKDTVKEMLPVRLKKIISKGEDIQLIDVREPSEHEAFNIGGELIPIDELLSNVERVASGKPVIIYCRVGLRSHIAIQRLQEKYGFKNLYNLKGGIIAYLEK